MDLFEGVHRKDPSQPQLTAMIDVFSIIIIFLVAGTVFGTSSVWLPKNINLPRSFSKESIVTAPQLTLTREGVRTTFSTKIYRTDDFARANPEVLAQVKNEAEEFIKNLRPESKALGVLLNVVADKDTSYRSLFDVISVYREAGFQSLLFISQGEAVPKNEN